jgi:hypothetical protein
VRQQSVVAHQEARVSEAHTAALSVIRFQRELGDANRRAAFLVEQKHKPMVLDVLAETTRLLPQGTWLSELQVHGREVEITGYSKAAASLIPLIDASPVFSDAQFRSPLVQVEGSDAERFDLSFTLRDREAGQ